MRNRDYAFDYYAREAQRLGYRSRAALKLKEIHEKFKVFKPGMSVLDLGAAPGGWCQAVKKWIGCGRIGTRKETGSENSAENLMNTNTNNIVESSDGIVSGIISEIGVTSDAGNIKEIVSERETENTKEIKSIKMVKTSNGIEKSKGVGNILSRIVGIDILPMDPIHGIELLQCDINDFVNDEKFAGNKFAENKFERGKFDVVMSDMCPNKTGNTLVDQARLYDITSLALETAKRTLVSDGQFICKFFEGQYKNEFKQALEQAFKKCHVFKPKSSRDVSSEFYFYCSGLKS